MSEKPKKVRIVLEFEVGSKPLMMLEDLKEERGYAHNPPVIIEALASLHRKSFPAGYYSTQKRPRSDSDDYDPTEDENEIIVRQEEKKIARKEAQKKIADKKYRDIASQLKGEVIEKGPGNFVVRYFQYSGRNRNTVTVSLSSMHEGLVRKQYYPSKEEVESLQKEGKCNYSL